MDPQDRPEETNPGDVQKITRRKGGSMSNKSIKKEYVILAVVIVALLLYLVFRSEDSVHYQLPELNSIDAKTLTKIEIAKPDQTLKLVKKENKWLIEPNDYPTDESKLNDITGTICDLTLTALASKARNYSRYHLDNDNAIRVKAYQKEQVVREFEIGKTTPTNNHTFVKLKEDDRVYHADKSFRRHFDQEPDDLRDKVVMKLDTNAVSEIEVEKEGKKYVFTKTAKPVEAKTEEAKKEEGKKDEKVPPVEKTETIWASNDGKEGNKTELDSILDQLSDLRCDQYLDDKKKEDFKEPIYTIKIKGQKEYVLSIYEKHEEPDKEGKTGSDKYPVLSSENPYPFLLSTYKAERLMKNPGELLKK